MRLYEANERVQLIRDRNNQEFVDRMYVTYLLDQGLVAPRPDRKLAAVAVSDANFAKRVGLATDTRLDRLWQLPPDAPQWSVLSGRLWYRGLASSGAIDQSRQIMIEIGTVQRAIAAELSSRRWP